MSMTGSTASPAQCPYCGMYGGVHVWAGTGQCPGIQDEAYTELCEENERLLRELGNLKRLNAEERATIDDLAKLCLHAADALEGKPVYDALANYKLIDELRKAAGVDETH